MLLACGTMIGASVNGTLAIGSGGVVTVSLTSIYFGPDPSSNPPGNGIPAAPWDAEVATATALSFSGCGGVLGSAGCLDSAPFAPNEAVEINHDMALTPETILPEDGFLLFAGNGITHANLDYTLFQIGAGSSNTNCAGLEQFQSCSVYQGYPIIMTLEGTGTTATLNLAGLVTDSTGASRRWVGTFSSTLSNITPYQLQLFFCPSGTCTPADFDRGTSISTSQSGAFISELPLPEPPLWIGSLLFSIACALKLGIKA